MQKWVIIFLVLLVLLILVIVGPTLLMVLGLLLTENPEKPKYTYGEYPFLLEYKLNEKIITIEDTVIIEYDGFGLSTGIGGKYIKWKQTLASGNDEVVLYEGEDEDEVSLRLIYPVRERNYHMEDEQVYIGKNISNMIREVRKGEKVSKDVISEYELIEEYKIEILRFEYKSPKKK